MLEEEIQSRKLQLNEKNDGIVLGKDLKEGIGFYF